MRTLTGKSVYPADYWGVRKQAHLKFLFLYLKKIVELTLVNTTYKGSAKFEATVDLSPSYPSLLSKKRSLIFLSVICTPCL